VRDVIATLSGTDCQCSHHMGQVYEQPDRSSLTITCITGTIAPESTREALFGADKSSHAPIP
jgi:hypothetical protein